MMTRTQPDLDGGTFDAPDIVVLPADWYESPEEQEAFDVIWPLVEIGGEA